MIELLKNCNICEVSSTEKHIPIITESEILIVSDFSLSIQSALPYDFDYCMPVKCNLQSYNNDNIQNCSFYTRQMLLGKKIIFVDSIGYQQLSLNDIIGEFKLHQVSDVNGIIFATIDKDSDKFICDIIERYENGKT